MYEKLEVFFFRLDLAEISAKLKCTNLFTLNSYKNRRSRSRLKLKIMMETQEEHRYKFHCPIRHPSRVINEIRFHIQVKWFRQKNGENGICAMPRSILQFSIWNLTSYLDRMCKQTQSRPFPLESSALSPPNFTLIGNEDFYTNIVWKSCCFWVFADTSARSCRKKKTWNLLSIYFFCDCSMLRQGQRFQFSSPNS